MPAAASAAAAALIGPTSGSATPPPSPHPPCHPTSPGYRGSAGYSGETHFNVEVVSSRFEGLTSIKRHRLVYQILDEEMRRWGAVPPRLTSLLACVHARVEVVHAP